jgi:hypothetical protein
VSGLAIGDFVRRLAQAYQQWLRPHPQCYWCGRPFSLMTQGITDVDRVFCFECYRHHVLCKDATMARK